jgi:hypothetical protein
MDHIKKRIQGAKESRVRVKLQKNTWTLKSGQINMIYGWLFKKQQNITDVKRIHRALIKSVDNKLLNPRILESSNPFLQQLREEP